jgi:hypothetical protein
VLQRIDEPTAATGGASLPKLSAEQDAALMRAACAAGVPAPELILVLEPQDGLGPGYVTRHVAGETLVCAGCATTCQRTGTRPWWAISCVRRGSARRPDGRPAGVELAAIGRRMEEPLWDLLNLTAA